MQKKIKIMSLFLLLLFCNLSLVKSTTIPSSYSTIEKDYLSMQVVDTESPATLQAAGDTKMDRILSDSLKNAMDVNDYAKNVYLLSDNPNNRSFDLSIVQMVLAYIDMFFTTQENIFLEEALNSVQALKLDIYGTFIIGKKEIAKTSVYASDNFLLVLMYERLALALNSTLDVRAITYWNKANSTLSQLVSHLYGSISQSINTTLYLDSITYIPTGTSNYASAEATALFSMANYLAYNNSLFYNETQNAMDNYYSFGITNVNIPSFGYFDAYVETVGSGNDSDYQVSLRGNLYMATALLQQSAYQYYYGDMYMSDFYFFLAEAIEIASIPSIFFSTQTNLFHTSYNITSSSLSPFAFTYENCIALSQYTEFYRASFDRWGIPPDFYALATLYETLEETVFEEPLFFRGGITSSLSPIFLNWQEAHLNPLIVNYHAITMLTKFFPITIDLVTPVTVLVGEEIVFDWVIDNSETSSIFGSSSALLPKDLEILLSLTIDANITDTLTLPLITTILDGLSLLPSLFEKLNFTSFQGGHQELKIEAKRAAFIVLEHTHKFYITKLIGIVTEPTNIEFIEGYDENIFFAIFCHDEDGIGIENAYVNFTINEEVLFHMTDTSGYVYVELPIERFLPDDQEIRLQAQDEFSAVSTNITIMASKIGYFSKITEKTIRILRNSLILTISPSPPTVKEGLNLPISLSVESSIQANVQSPKARIYINNIMQNSTSGLNQFNLPTSVILSTSKIKEDSELSIIIISGNFKPTWFNMSLQFTLLGTLERIYTWFEYLLQSDIAKILGSLGVIWVLLFKQFRLRVLKSLQRCPYCGETMKRKYSVCRYCGEILHREKYDIAKEKTRPKQMEMEN